ncbi:MAG: DUF885 domain-containing protein [Acetatifactor sp.]|nr:DUF885 domain-containing protein [Acetatifactor sp.]
MKRRAMLSWKQLLVLCCLLFTFAGLTAFLFGYQRDEKRFTQISSQLFTDEISGNTLNMHYTLAYPANFGIYDYKATLPTYSAESRHASQAATEELLHTLGELKPQKLSPSNRYTYILLMRSLKSSLELSNYTYYEEPLSPSSGMQSQLPILLAEYTFRTRRDVEDYLALLDQTDDYFLSLLTFEQEKAKAGLLMSAASLEKVKKQCDTILTKEELEAGTHFLQTTFTERLRPLISRGIITEEEALQYQAQNNRLLKTVMLPAYETLADGLFVLEDETIPLSGLASKPEGREYYRRLLISETGSYRDITEVEQLLLNKFYEEYNAILTLTADHPEVLEQIYNDAFVNFPISGADAMLADLQARMSADFPGLPTVSDNVSPTVSSLPTATVKAVSPSLEDYSAPAFYLTAPIDDSDSNVIYINQSTSPSGLELYTILAHEGYPGHLYQTVYSNRSFLQKEENKVRELLWYGGYLEGWGLYTEFYSFDYAADIYSEQGDDPAAVLTQLEQHDRSLQLCLYCLLDIMIHYENASYSQVVDVLKGMGIEDSSSVRAVYAYLVEEPCNYLKYYVGYLEILQLKEEAKTLWDEEYSDLRFHTFYLDCGPSDFTTLRERLVEEAADS